MTALRHIHIQYYSCASVSPSAMWVNRIIITTHSLGTEQLNCASRFTTTTSPASADRLREAVSVAEPPPPHYRTLYSTLQLFAMVN